MKAGFNNQIDGCCEHLVVAQNDAADTIWNIFQRIINHKEKSLYGNTNTLLIEEKKEEKKY